VIVGAIAYMQISSSHNNEPTVGTTWQSPEVKAANNR
jgi:hypothetical protein